MTCSVDVVVGQKIVLLEVGFAGSLSGDMMKPLVRSAMVQVNHVLLVVRVVRQLESVEVT